MEKIKVCDRYISKRKHVLFFIYSNLYFVFIFFGLKDGFEYPYRKEEQKEMKQCDSRLRPGREEEGASKVRK